MTAYQVQWKTIYQINVYYAVRSARHAVLIQISVIRALMDINFNRDFAYLNVFQLIILIKIKKYVRNVMKLALIALIILIIVYSLVEINYIFTKINVFRSVL